MESCPKTWNRLKKNKNFFAPSMASAIADIYACFILSLFYFTNFAFRRK